MIAFVYIFFTESRQLRVIRELRFSLVQVSSAFLSGFSAWDAITVRTVFFSGNNAKSFKSSETPFFLNIFRRFKLSVFKKMFTGISRCLLVPLGWRTVNHEFIVMYSCKKRLNKTWVIYSLFSIGILENCKLRNSY